MYDIIQQPTVTHTSSGGSNPTYAYDGDFGTYHGVTWGRSTGGSLTNTHEFLTSVDIVSIRFKYRAQSAVSGADEYGSSGAAYIYLQYWDGDNWITISTGDLDYDGTHGHNGSCDSGVVDATEAVSISTTKIRINAGGSNTINGGVGTGSGLAYAYELQVHVNSNWDSAGVIQYG